MSLIDVVGDGYSPWHVGKALVEQDERDVAICNNEHCFEMFTPSREGQEYCQNCERELSEHYQDQDLYGEGR